MRVQERPWGPQNGQEALDWPLSGSVGALAVTELGRKPPGARSLFIKTVINSMSLYPLTACLVCPPTRVFPCQVREQQAVAPEG